MRPPVIVFLDEATVNIGDLDLSPLKRLGYYRRFRATRSSEILPRASRAEILITNKCLLGTRELKNLPSLRLICVAATGTNNIDLRAARRCGIAVANVPVYSTTSVAEQTFLMILALGHRLLEHHAAAIGGTWVRSKIYTIPDFPFFEVSGKTLGIVGYGAIGREVARLARAFGMKVLLARLPGRRYPRVPRRLPLQEVLKRSDFVSLHCPLTPRTYRLMNIKTLRLMRRSAYLLNLARGDLVDERAVSRALKKGTIAGLAADVLSKEPPSKNHPFFRKGVREKVLLTPHVAWASIESRQRLIDEIARNIAAFQKGFRRNQVV